MKSAIIILAAVLGLLVLVFSITKPDRSTPPKSSVKIDFVIIDGCQYIVTPAGEGASTITHKGNCTNAVHAMR